MAGQRILIVDSSESFATMLQEGLESSGPYQAAIASSGTKALDAIMQNNIDLIIIDMGLEDMDGLTLMQSLRQSKPDLRVILIPLFGQELTDQTLLSEIQGVLPKPFFIGDLPKLMQEALGQPETDVTETVELLPAKEPSTPHPKPTPAPKAAISTTFTTSDVDGLLEELFQEIRAEAVIFIQGANLLAHAGNVTQQRAQELAILAQESLNAIHKIAAFLGETDDHFEQCTFEGDEYSVYSTNVTPETILSVALSARTPVGIVRYNLRRAAQALAAAWPG